MHLLKAGKVSFLEFLRNLTPQILLGTLALICFGRVTSDLGAMKNFGLIFCGAVFSATLLLAALANSIQFLVNYHAAHPIYGPLLKGQNLPSLTVGDVQKIAKANGSALGLPMFALILFVELILLGALLMAGFNALSIVSKV